MSTLTFIIFQTLVLVIAYNAYDLSKYIICSANQTTKMSKTITNLKCRGGKYPFSNISRIVFPDNLIPWSAPFEAYNPPDYTAPSLKGKPYADPDINDSTFQPKWNQLDGNVNRVSFTGAYAIAADGGRPLNPVGRTGLAGRGVLGRWGPNHAADPIVTRWKIKDNQKQIHPQSQKPILQFCAIQRKDNHNWAIPGGMVDPGEQVSETLRREFMEEALNSLQSNPEQRNSDKRLIEEFFKKGREVYKGYVDDPRNTDNAWMETVAFNYHDETGNSVGKFELRAGDDAKKVRWMDVDKNLDLYASHVNMLEQVAKLHGAHW